MNIDESSIKYDNKKLIITYIIISMEMTQQKAPDGGWNKYNNKKLINIVSTYFISTILFYSCFKRDQPVPGVKTGTIN